MMRYWWKLALPAANESERSNDGESRSLEAGRTPGFFDVTETEAMEALGPSRGVFLAGPQLDARLDQIEKFLTEKLRRTDDSGR